jgi:endonuclease G, mitochondrial
MEQGAQFQSLLEDQDLVDELRSRAAAGKLPLAQKLGVAPALLDQALEKPRSRLMRGGALESIPGLKPARGRRHEATPRPPAPPLAGGAAIEAIVLEQGRPSLIVQNGTFDLPDSKVWRTTLERARDNIEHTIARVGRVELHNHLSYQWVGTGWLVADNIIATNRHVAEEFAVRNGVKGLAFAKNILGQPISAQMDFREEYEVNAALEVAVTKILYLAGPNDPDIALLKIASDVPLPEPLMLADREAEQRQLIGIVGYPAFDSRNGLDAMRRYFGEVFDVKRFAPGRVSFPTPDEHYFVHDCTTLGGNSGSEVIDLETGRVIGLHFSGAFLSGNFAVKAKWIKAALKQIKSRVAVKVPQPQAAEAVADGRHQPKFFTNRDGYQPGFLDLDVKLPKLGRWSKDAVPVSGTGRQKNYELKYRHFSVVMSESRKLPILTAVNINGAEARRIFRADDKWYLDLRIPEEFQLGNEVYRNNDLDRGHMVRRLDPVWGEPDEAMEANDDTFHYVNSTPQHKDLNQREWNDLEEYILDSAKIKDLKVSVFTGPIFRDSDQDYRGLVKIPQEFWKIAVLVNADTNNISAAGYVLSQGEMIKDITEAAFVYGKFRTYQILISNIEEVTGLDFRELRDHDSLVRERGRREAPLPRAVAIRGPRDLIL